MRIGYNVYFENEEWKENYKRKKIFDGHRHFHIRHYIAMKNVV